MMMMATTMMIKRNNILCGWPSIVFQLQHGANTLDPLRRKVLQHNRFLFFVVAFSMTKKKTTTKNKKKTHGVPWLKIRNSQAQINLQFSALYGHFFNK
jgi:hypothetical protein